MPVGRCECTAELLLLLLLWPLQACHQIPLPPASRPTCGHDASNCGVGACGVWRKEKGGGRAQQALQNQIRGKEGRRGRRAPPGGEGATIPLLR